MTDDCSRPVHPRFDHVVGELHDGTVGTWLDDEGWGVINSSATPGGCWTHFSAIVAGGYQQLVVGTRVTFTFQAAQQDGFGYRAVQVWPEGVAVGETPEPETQDSPGAYTSTLTITLDGEPVDAGQWLRQAERDASRQRLQILDALSLAVDRRAEVLAVIADADDYESATDQLADLLEVSGVAALAIMDMQLRRFCRLSARRIREDRDALAREIGSD